MTDAERIAKAMYEAPFVDGREHGAIWPPPDTGDRAWWMHLGEIAARVQKETT